MQWTNDDLILSNLILDMPANVCFTKDFNQYVSH